MKRALTLRPVVPAALATIATCWLAGCNLAPKLDLPQGMVPAQVDAAHTAAPVVAGADQLVLAQAQAWIQHPALREVVALALTHNRDLRVAATNVEKVRAQYGITRADLLPSVTAQAQATRSRTAADLSNTGRSTIGEQFTAQLGFASYELDLWGRVRNLGEAGWQAALQSEATQRNVQLGLVAEVSNAWLTLAANEARLVLAQETLASRERALALTQRMFELGSTSGLVLAQNQSTVETARGDVATYTAQVQRDRHALELLVGGAIDARWLPTAQTLAPQADSPAALVPVPVPLPSSVLLQRPDVQAAEHNLRAMNANIGAARAARFPSISLTGSVGSGSRELDALFGAGNGTWSFMPQIRLPIFDGGRLRAGVAVAEANQRVALAQYEKAIQTAFKETADGLADRAQWAQRLQAQTAMVAATHKAFDLSQARFQAGVDNYLTVLDAQRSLYAAQQTLITLRLAEQLNRITLWKVLGGETGLAAGTAPAAEGAPVPAPAAS